MTDWIIQNKTWIFSGIGIFILGSIVAFTKWFLTKKKNNPTHSICVSENNSVSVIGKVKGDIVIKDNSAQS